MPTRACRYPIVATLLLLGGCGTTRWSDTSRTGTEQLLLSSAVDQSINNIDFTPLSGKAVYFDEKYLQGVTDSSYIISSMRQHMLAYGCILKEDRAQAEYIVEARAGAMGTNRHDLMLGVPALNVPSVALAGGGMTGVPSVIPEMPFAKTTDQKGIAKIAVFAYNRETGAAAWQSGVFPVATNAKDSWILGMGPFQKGTIYSGTRFAGSRWIFSRDKSHESLVKPAVPVSAEAVFKERPVVARAPTGELTSAEAPAAGDSVTAASAPALAPTAERPAPEVVQAHIPDDAPGQSSEAEPAVQIKRLPPVEQAARPDLQDVIDDREEASDDDHAPAHEDHEDAPSLFRPRTWFGGGGK
jgi:hypothetical protein